MTYVQSKILEFSQIFKLYSKTATLFKNWPKHQATLSIST